MAVPVEILKKTPLFRDLDADTLGEAASELAFRRFAADGVLMQQGQRGDSCYLIQEGEVRVTRAVGAGDPIELATLGPGAVVGQIALLVAGPRSASCVASEPTLAVEIDRAALDRLLARRSPLGWRLLQSIVALETAQLRGALDRLRAIHDRRFTDGADDGGGAGPGLPARARSRRPTTPRASAPAPRAPRPPPARGMSARDAAALHAWVRDEALPGQPRAGRPRAQRPTRQNLGSGWDLGDVSLSDDLVDTLRQTAAFAAKLGIDADDIQVVEPTVKRHRTRRY